MIAVKEKTSVPKMSVIVFNLKDFDPYADKYLFPCSNCGKKWVTRRMHESTHNVNNEDKEKPFACCHCGRGFLRKHEFKHYKMNCIHKNIHKCSYCELTFNTFQYLSNL